DGAVGLDVERQAVVVGGLLDPGRLDGEGHPPDGREDRVDGDHADGRRALGPVDREVAPALPDGDVERQAALAVDRGDVEIGVEDLDVGGRLDVGGGDVGRAALVEPEDDRLRRLRAQHQVFQIEDDVGDVFLDAGHHVELVEGVVEAYGGDRRARDGRQEGPAEAVAERVAEARLEGRNREALPVALGLAERLHGGALDHQHVRRLPQVLLRVKLDDQLLPDGDVDVLPHRQVTDGDLGAAAAVDFEPGRHGP